MIFPLDHPILRAQELLDQITYKPNVRINVLRSMDADALEFRISRGEVDSGDYLNTVMICSVFMIRNDFFKDLSDEGFLQILRSHLIQFELHELDEFFKFGGKHVKDPHPERI